MVVTFVYACLHALNVFSASESVGLLLNSSHKISDTHANVVHGGCGGSFHSGLHLPVVSKLNNG